MSYNIKNVRGHIEIYDSDGTFWGSADTLQEAMQDIKEMEEGVTNYEQT